MKGIIKLNKAIMIDGKEIKELSYDTDKITINDYMKALNASITKGGGMTGVNVKLDAGAQTYIGMYAVLADNPRYDLTDMERVKGPDIMKFTDIGLSFIAGREDLTEEPSEEQSDPIAEPSTLMLSESETEV